MQSKQSFKAVVVGATGVTGSLVTKILAETPKCKQVVALARRSMPSSSNEKIVSHKLDFEKELNVSHFEGAHACFFTLGANISSVGFDQHKKVEYDLVVHAAKLAKRAGVTHATLLSAVGADMSSNIPYVKLKAQTEQALLELAFPTLSIFRPSTIITERENQGFFEKLAVTLSRQYEWMIPAMYKGVTAETLARAMVNACLTQTGAVEIYNVPEIMQQAKMQAAATDSNNKTAEKSL